MTTLLDEHEIQDTVMQASDPAFVEMVRSYVSTDLFRSARFDELVLDDNPYRRPVRPEDLDWLRFDDPLTIDSAARLSGLLGHRILLNIYDARRPLLPRVMTSTRWQDMQTFYSPALVAQGQSIRPVLERHAYSFVKDAGARSTTVGLGGAVAADEELRRIAADVSGLAADVQMFRRTAEHKDRIDRTIAIQLIGQRIASPLRLTSMMLDDFGAPGSVAPHESFTAGMTFGHAARTDSTLREFVAEQGLSWAPHNYFQFYLPTTLALMNYVSMRATRIDDPFALMGAMATSTLLTDSLLSARTGDMNPSAPDIEHTLAWLSAVVRDSLVPRYGSRGLERFVAGALEFEALVTAHHRDLMTQLRWIDADAAYAAKARRLQRAITDEHLEVELDTFVETSEECSTAHVHDDVRLVVIESGTMKFWNCYGELHTFQPGDAMYVPQHRLHGSVVTSGTCVYHQPVITDETDRIYG